MKILIVIINIVIPIIMVAIGLLYKKHLYTKVNKLLEIFMPVAILGSGVGPEDTKLEGKNIAVNKKCALIWFCLGIASLLLSIIVLVLNKTDIISSGATMIGVDLAIVVVAFVSCEYLIRKNK